MLSVCAVPDLGKECFWGARPDGRWPRHESERRVLLTPGRKSLLLLYLFDLPIRENDLLVGVGVDLFRTQIDNFDGRA